MNITLNLSHEEIQEAVSDYITKHGHSVGNTCILFKAVELPGNDAITVSVSMALGPAESLDVAPATVKKEKRTRRTAAQIKQDKQDAVDKENALTATSDANNAQSGGGESEGAENGIPGETDAEEEIRLAAEPEQGDISDLKEKSEPTKPKTSLFAMAQ